MVCRYAISYHISLDYSIVYYIAPHHQAPPGLPHRPAGGLELAREYVYVCMYVYIYIYIYVCVYLYMYIYIYAYTYTTHTYIYIYIERERDITHMPHIHLYVTCMYMCVHRGSQKCTGKGMRRQGTASKRRDSLQKSLLPCRHACPYLRNSERRSPQALPFS